MSVFKTTFTRALRAHPSDNANIAYPNVIETGTSTSVVASKLVNSTGIFITNNVRVGDVVHNDTLGTAATVVTVRLNLP